MAKPIKLPTWATGAAAITEPPDAKKAQGWVAGEQPPAAFFNYWQNLVHQWVEWFDENVATDETAGDLLVNGTLGTTGNTTVGSDGSGNLQVNGTLGTTGLATVAALTTAGLATIGGNLDVAGNATVGTDGSGNLQVNGTFGTTGLATIGGNLDVAGNTTVGSDGSGDLHVNGSATVSSLSSTGDATIGSDGSGNLLVNGTLTTTGLTTVGGNLDVNGNSDVLGGDFRVLAGDCKVSGLYAYTSPPSRTKILPIGNCYGEVFRDGLTGDVSSSAGGYVAWPIELPQGATLTSVEVIGSQNGTSPTTLKIIKRSGYDWTSGAGPSETSLDSDTSPSSAGNYKVTLTTSTVIDNAAEEYQVHFDSGQSGDDVAGIRVTFTDPGPRNH